MTLTMVSQYTNELIGMDLVWRIGMSFLDFCLNGEAIDLRIGLRFWKMGLLLQEWHMYHILLASYTESKQW